MAHFTASCVSSLGCVFHPHLSEELLSLVTHARSWKKSMRTDVSSFSSRVALSTQDTARLTVCMFGLLLLQLVQSNFVLFCTYAADLRDHFQNIVLTILVSGSFFLNYFFNQKFSKVFQVPNFCLDEFYLKTFAPSDVVALLTCLLAPVSAGFCCD